MVTPGAISTDLPVGLDPTTSEATTKAIMAL